MICTVWIISLMKTMMMRLTNHHVLICMSPSSSPFRYSEQKDAGSVFLNFCSNYRLSHMCNTAGTQQRDEMSALGIIQNRRPKSTIQLGKKGWEANLNSNNSSCVESDSAQGSARVTYYCSICARKSAQDTMIPHRRGKDNCSNSFPHLMEGIFYDVSETERL